ncbi:MAG: polysaccharide deacetylase family protein [Clostridiales bacterium]|nr:polysaccharide deacetylase family protein [Clostridiales bacterium]
MKILCFILFILSYIGGYPAPTVPNEIGNIMIVMYHGLSDTNKYDRSSEGFLSDLQKLYDNGYRLLSLHDLIDGNITTPAGYTPVVLTFDDGKQTTFSLREDEGELVPAEGCMVDMLNEFCEEHPDFGKAATFFVYGSDDTFKGAGTLEQRFAYLLENGYEIGNHTLSHANLKNLGAARIQEEIGLLDQRLRLQCGEGYLPRAIAFPNGERPGAENLRAYAADGECNGEAYHYDWALRVGESTVTANPFHIKFEPLNVPRVIGADESNAAYAVHDLGYFLRYYEDNPEAKYISDGDPETVTVPKELTHLVNGEAAEGMGVRVEVYREIWRTKFVGNYSIMPRA